ncbi:MAG: helix-turn-helix transcriptional regulator [Phascolarctobacterium sp.]|nr:helix-turn-helix transcriptional regulator [Phascolarctobacterium sp.]
MVNANKLKGKIIEKGYNVSTLSKEINMDKATFYRKLNNDSDFSIKEADRIIDVLCLDFDEVKAIFFSQLVA